MSTDEILMMICLKGVMIKLNSTTNDPSERCLNWPLPHPLTDQYWCVRFKLILTPPIADQYFCMLKLNITPPIDNQYWCVMLHSLLPHPLLINTGV